MRVRMHITAIENGFLEFLLHERRVGSPMLVVVMYQAKYGMLVTFGIDLVSLTFDTSEIIFNKLMVTQNQYLKMLDNN